MVRVVTADGEWFPVRRKLLRPCIALTKAVRSEEAAEVAVDVNTLDFDRCRGWGVGLVGQGRGGTSGLGRGRVGPAGLSR